MHACTHVRMHTQSRTFLQMHSEGEGEQGGKVGERENEEKGGRGLVRSLYSQIHPCSLSLVLMMMRSSLQLLCGKQQRDAVRYEDMKDIDRFMLHRLHCLSDSMASSYDAYNMVAVSQALSAFINSYLNSFSFEIYKDRPVKLKG